MVALACSGEEGPELRSAALTQATAGAAFDWTMPERLRVVPATNALDTSVDLTPDGWPVVFDACASSGNVREFHWTIESDPQDHTTDRCDGFTYMFRSEGIYAVTLRVVDASGASATTSRDVNVQDWLIVALGDSYGSGEGTPNAPIPQTAFDEWANATAAHAQALLDLAEADRILAIVGRIRTPLARLTNANIALTEANVRLVRYCWNPFTIEECLQAGADAAAASAEIVRASADLGYQVTAASTEAAFSHLNPAGDLWDQLLAIEQVWATARDMAVATIGAAEAVFANRDLTFQPSWQDEQCHRSMLAGQVQAAFAIEQADPRSSVTLLHLACSGAQIIEGLLGSYGGVEPSKGSPLDPQVLSAALQLEGREIDALLVSIGGNDANFSPIVIACMTQEPCHATSYEHQTLAQLNAYALCAAASVFSEGCGDYFQEISIVGGGTSAADLFVSGIGNLAPRYALLASELASRFPDVTRQPSRVYITEYPDASLDERGDLCGPRPDRLDPFVNLPGLSPGEWLWAGETVTRDHLNAQVAAAAAEHGWTLVDGIYDGFAGHGYCSDSAWFVRLQQSLRRQGDKNGTLHPNQEGHAHVGARLADTVRPHFYTDGDMSSPRAPQVPPYADLGLSRVLDEGSSEVIQHHSYDPSRSQTTAYLWSLEVDAPGGAGLDGANDRSPRLQGIDDSSGLLRLVISNAFGEDTGEVSVAVRNVAPVVSAGPDIDVPEGAVVSLQATFTDPGAADTHEASVRWEAETTPAAMTSGGEVTGAHRYLDEGVHEVVVTVRDDDSGASEDTFRVQVENVAPTIQTLSGPTFPVLPGAVVTVQATFEDPGPLDRHESTWSWGDGTTAPGELTETDGAGTLTAQHRYTSPGVYEPRLLLVDDDGGASEAVFQYVVVFDPEAGSLTGAGAWAPEAGPIEAGRRPTTFAVRGQYLHDATAVSGWVRVSGTSIDFHGDSLEWLVITGGRAYLRGSGSVSGVAGHGFLLIAEDGAISDGPDRLRIRVWDEVTGGVVFDNASVASDDPLTGALPEISYGNLVLHR